MADSPRRIRRLATTGLSPAEIEAVRALLWVAFADDEHGGFDENDWQHALGGTHFLAERDGRIVSHAAVVERELHVASVPLRTGYVEAVATAPAEQGRGHGGTVMREVNEHIRGAYDLGALGTGSHAFYARLGWQTWGGSSFVRTPDGDVATPDEDGYILVLLTTATAQLDLTAPISCDWRAGDVW